ncbi:unnamed protein product [Schistocephalus solidus]|uniref:Glycine dehydrogenase (aminomethyl-transferring) n=1 Tax=Schistocephalus solidus TaxID=70667 RepID=A0A183T7R0_SCHSO|nr:unnamed protein product [Schistocephalus solidus]
MEQLLLEKLTHGVSDTEVRKIFLHQQPSTLDNTCLALPEQAFQGVYASPSRVPLGAAVVCHHASVNAGTQMPRRWRSIFPQQSNWRRQPLRRFTGPHTHHPIQAIDMGPRAQGYRTPGIGNYFVSSRFLNHQGARAL